MNGTSNKPEWSVRGERRGGWKRAECAHSGLCAWLCCVVLLRACVQCRALLLLRVVWFALLCFALCCRA